MISLEVATVEGHRKYADMTLEETAHLIGAIEDGTIEGVEGGPYFVINKNTRRPVGKLDIKGDQELVMLPIVSGG